MWLLFLSICVWKFYSAHCLNTYNLCVKWVYTYTAIKQPLRIENHTLHLVVNIIHTKEAKYSKLTIYRGHSRQDIHSDAQLIFIARIMCQCQVNWSNGKFDAVYSMGYIVFYLFINIVGKTLHMTIRHLVSHNCNSDKAVTMFLLTRAKQWRNQIWPTELACHCSRLLLWPLLLTWFNFNPSMDK